MISRVHYAFLAACHRRNVNFVELLLPWHLGGVYAYLSGSLLIGSMITAAFVSLICFTK